MIFEIISGGGETDWVGKEWAGLFFPRGKNGPAHSFPGEKLTGGGGEFRPVTPVTLPGMGSTVSHWNRAKTVQQYLLFGTNR